MIDRIEISATAGEQLRVERYVAGQLSQRYLTADLKKLPKGHEFKPASWKLRVIELCSQPSAGIVIKAVEIPVRQLTALETANLKVSELQFELDNIKEFIHRPDELEEERLP